jgi:hypothetical protein
MTAIAEIGHDPELLAGFEATIAHDRLPDEEDAAAMAAVYQQIADRRAQLEDADVLRRARSL